MLFEKLRKFLEKFGETNGSNGLSMSQSISSRHLKASQGISRHLKASQGLSRHLKASEGISRHLKCCRIHRAEYAAKKQGSKKALEQRTILKKENLFFKLSQELVQLKLCECQSCLRQAAAKQNPRSQQAHKDGNKVQPLSLVSFGFRRDMSDIKHIKHLIVT
jgi:hypothetical protein